MEEKRSVQINIVKAPLPETINGVIGNNAAGKNPEAYTVLINSALEADQQAAAFLHEMLHLWHNDLNKTDETARHIEDEREAELLRILEIMRNS